MARQGTVGEGTPLLPIQLYARQPPSSFAFSPPSRPRHCTYVLHLLSHEASRTT